MPYIDNEQRKKYQGVVNAIKQGPFIETKGDLEYLIFTLMKQFMRSRESRYSSLHDCTYAVQHCADEFRRRYLDRREDEAREDNGDIEVKESF